MTLRNALLLAVLASTGLAFRQNVANVMKHVAKADAEPPNIDEMMEKAVSVSAAKLQAAEAAAQAAQQALMAQMNPASRKNNTNKRNSSHSAVDDLWAANEARFVAAEVEAKVKQMKEVCEALIAAVLGFQKSSETRAQAEIATANEQQKDQHEELVTQVIEAEKLDLSRLLGLLGEIADAKAEVLDFDSRVKSGAAEGIAKATELVDSMAAQLQARLGSLDSVDAAAFAEMRLDPEDADLVVGKHAERSINRAGSKIDRLLQKVNREHESAQAALNEAMMQRKTNSTSKEEMHQMVNNIYELNQKIMDANMLREKITLAIQLISNFFEQLGSYRVKQNGQAKAAALGAEEIVKQGDEIRRAIEESVLADGGVFFHLYQTMWVRHNQAKEAMPADDGEYTPVSESITETAEAIHRWLNGEMISYCDKYPVPKQIQADANQQCRRNKCQRYCQSAQSKFLASTNKKRSAKVNWCDERFTKTRCIEENGGLAPNGKGCKWTEGDRTGKTGTRGRCDPNEAPTGDLPYGSGDTRGAGIFY
jgi:hypothetical protein